MDEQRKYAILFAATILAARKLNDPESKPWGIECVSLTQSGRPNASRKRLTSDGLAILTTQKKNSCHRNRPPMLWFMESLGN